MKKASLFLLLFIWASCALAQDESLEAKDTIRLQIVKDYTACAAWLSDVSGVKGAQEVVEFLSKNAVIVAPQGDSIRAINVPKADIDRYFLIPFLPGDENEDEIWRKMMKMQAGAIFDPSMLSMILRSDKRLSPFMMGLVYIHEGKHAIQYVVRKQESNVDPMVFCSLELEAHELQNKVCLAFGGEKYQAILEQEISRLKLIGIGQGGMVSISNKGPYSEALDSVFGPSISDFDRNGRQTHLWIHAVIELIDRSVPPEKAKLSKLKFLQASYRDVGTLSKP